MDQPIGMKGRTFLEDGVWVYLLVSAQPYVVKMTDENFKNAVAGKAFEAWHITVMGNNGPIYVPAVAGTVEPWYMNGAHCAAIALVHPDLAQKMDDGVKKSLSLVETATAADMPVQKDVNDGKPRLRLVK